MSNYFKTLVDRSGAGWNRFWYTPSDATTLGFTRLLTGVVCIYWYLTLIPDVVPLLSFNGLLPIDKLRGENPGALVPLTQFSIWNFMGSPSMVWVAYYVGLAVLVSFTLGFYSRISSILAYLVIISFAHRAPIAIGQFEQTLPLVLIGFCVGPSGASFSADRWLAQRKYKDYPVKLAAFDTPSVWATVGLRLIQLHLTLITVAMVIAKLRYGPWWTGGATWLLMVRPESRMFDFSGYVTGENGLDAPEKFMLLNAWTHMVIVFQLLFPLCIWNKLLRPLVIAISFVVWTLIGLVAGTIPFCALMFVATLTFIPGESLRRFLPGNGNKAQNARQTQTGKKSEMQTAGAK